MKLLLKQIVQDCNSKPITILNICFSEQKFQLALTFVLSEVLKVVCGFKNFSQSKAGNVFTYTWFS